MNFTINGTTTTFVGNYYEVSGTAVTKYYYAGAQRIAMSVGGAVYDLPSDQLGSTSIVVDDTQQHNLISELRYKAWGEARYTSGSTPTKYTYTGQYSNMTDFGLMYYNVRWYDPTIARFVQADSIVPDGVQGYDRYAYANNAPTRYTDPSGHAADAGGAGGQCSQANPCHRTMSSKGAGSSGYESKDGGWNYPWYSTWNTLRWGSACTACHVTHDEPGDWSIPTNNEIDADLVAYYRSMDPAADVIHAYAFGQLGLVASDLASATTATRGETADTILGKAMHRSYPEMLEEPSLRYNQQIPGTRLRPDAVDVENLIVRELKPDTPSGISRGLTQLGRYVDALQELTGQSWTGILDLYPK